MGSYQSNKDNEEQNLAYEEVLQLFNKSIKVAEKIEEFQVTRIQQCEQEQRQKEEEFQRAVARQKQMLEEYENCRFLKEFEEAVAEKERSDKQRQATDRAMTHHHQEYLRRQEGLRKQNEQKIVSDDFGERHAPLQKLLEDWRRQMDEELRKIEHEKQELAVEKRLQEEIVRQRTVEELNRIAIENALKELEEDDYVERREKDTGWMSVGTTKKEVKKKKQFSNRFSDAPITPFELLREKSLLTLPKHKPFELKPRIVQDKPKTPKKWAVPTDVLQTSSEPIPSQAVSKSRSKGVNFGGKHKKKKREKLREQPLEPSVLLDVNVVGNPDRVNAGEIDRMPPMPSKKKKKKC